MNELHELSENLKKLGAIQVTIHTIPDLPQYSYVTAIVPIRSLKRVEKYVFRHHTHYLDFVGFANNTPEIGFSVLRRERRAQDCR